MHSSQFIEIISGFEAISGGFLIYILQKSDWFKNEKYQPFWNSLVYFLYIFLPFLS